ncbi:PHD finger protein MALE STERILITY 1 [Linum grandiflorum]
MSRQHSDVSCCPRKRKRGGGGGGGGERVFRFKSFGQKGYPIEFEGCSFRQNVEALVEVGNSESNNNVVWNNGVGSMRSWSFQLEVNRHPPSHVFLFVLEELIEKSIDQHCKHCQYTGWGHHLVCNKKYHFVLPSKNTMAAFFDCIDLMNSSATSTTPNSISSGNGNCKGKLINFVELQDHIMYGVFHSNGFGHLLCLNGVESGSSLLPGRQIMTFWDHLCHSLKARKVSLNDISTKRSMELRLLHGIAYRAPWFGSWGYKFTKGSYGVIQPMYEKAIEALRAIPLCILVHYLGNSNHDIPIIFSRYQMLSDHSLTTLGDMFHFMLELRTRLAEENLLDSYTGSGLLVEQTCRWSPKRIEMATRAIVEALKRAEFRWVSRQEVRDAARIYIGDTGLLDFVLKSLGNHMVGNYLVRRCLNPVTKVLEYCLEDVSNVVVPVQESGSINNSKVKATQHYRISKSQLMKDMFYLYKYILKDYNISAKQHQQLQSNSNSINNKLNMGILNVIPTAVRIILDAKYFAKEYHGDQPLARVELGTEDKLSIHCTVMLRNNNNNNNNTMESQDDGTTISTNTATSTTSPMLMPLFECVRLRRNATFDELRVEVERSFREMYWGMKNLSLDSVANLEANGKDLVFGQVEVGGKVIFQGRIGTRNHHNQNEDDMMTAYYYEGGLNWSRVVVCGCGAKEDDGERMVACDICEVWQHTKCVGIPQHQQIPQIFLCKRCENEIVILPAFP